jgi:hypothetical protein
MLSRAPSQAEAKPTDGQSPVEVRLPWIARLGPYFDQYAIQFLVGATALYILLRLLTITDRSPSIALAFVEASGLVSTILGLVLQLLPEVLLLAAAAATGIVLQRTLVRLATGTQEKLSDDEHHAWTALYVVGTILWALVLTTVPSPIGEDGFSLAAEFGAGVAMILAIVGGLYGAIRNRGELGAPQITWKTYWALPWLAVATGLLLLSHVALDRRLWLPPERITVPASVEHLAPETVAGTVARTAQSGQSTTGGRSGDQDSDDLGQLQDSIVGYVLHADDEWTTVLLERPRVVVRLETDEIVDRTVCRLAARSLPPSALLQLVGRQQRDVTPPCQGV